MSKRLALTFAGVFVLVLVLAPAFFYQINLTPQNKARQVVQRCGGNLKEDCYRQVFKELVKSNDAEFALSTLGELNKIDRESIHCHSIAHDIAGAAVEKNPSSWERLLSIGDLRMCSMGFFHGVIEGHSRYTPDFYLEPKTIKVICEKIASSSEDSGKDRLSGECIHIIGHLLVVQEYGDINKAIDTCLRLPEADQKICSYGAFMEQTSQESLKNHGLAKLFPWNEENIHIEEELCKSFEDPAQHACWEQLSAMYAIHSQFDSEKVWESCNNAPKKEYRTDCYLLGAGLIAINIGGGQVKDQKIGKLCDPFKDEEDYKSCTAFIVRYVLDAYPNYLPVISEYCDGLGENKEFCMERVVQRFRKKSSKDSIKGVCQDAGYALREVCSRIEMNKLVF